MDFWADLKILNIIDLFVSQIKAHCYYGVDINLYIVIYLDKYQCRLIIPKFYFHIAFSKVTFQGSHFFPLIQSANFSINKLIFKIPLVSL